MKQSFCLRVAGKEVRLTRLEQPGRVEYLVVDERRGYRCSLDSRAGLQCTCRAGEAGRRCLHKQALLTAETARYRRLGRRGV